MEGERERLQERAVEAMEKLGEEARRREELQTELASVGIRRTRSHTKIYKVSLPKY